MTDPATMPRASLTTLDRFTIGLLIFFILVANTFQFYWLRHANELMERAEAGDLFASLFSVYGRADDHYYGSVSAFTRGLESLHVCVTQFLYVWLIWAILRGTAYRHALQLTVGSYLTYSVILYHWEGHLSGYAAMSEKTPSMFLLLYGANAPWFIGNALMAYVSFRAIVRRFHESSSG